MQNLPEGLIYLLVLAFAYLANYLFNRFVPQPVPQPGPVEPGEGQMALEPSPGDLAAASTASATASPGPRVMNAIPSRPSHPAGPAFRRSRMESKRNMQAAVAMATILGPCRAFEPDGHHASPGR